MYFDQSRSVSNLTLIDLRNVLTSLSGGTKKKSNVETQQLRTSSESSLELINKQPIFEYGEYVACVWCDDGVNCLRWYLVVDDGMNNDYLLISYMEMSDKDGMKRLFLDGDENQSTKFD